jgi:hypothetical protein
MNKEQELFWGILSANPQTIAHFYGAELQRLAQDKNTVKFNLRADQILTLLMNTVTDHLQVIAVVKCWLSEYHLPFDPGSMTSFDRFHKTYGPLVISNPRAIPVL